MKKTRVRYPVVCHPDRPAVALGLCRACYQYYRTSGAPKDDPRMATLLGIVAAHDARKTLTISEWEKTKKERKRRDPQRYRKGRSKALKDRYGITIEDYEVLLREQASVCAICGASPGSRPLYVDHCHRTGKVRGLLCPTCNTRVAVADLGEEVLQGLLKYIRKHEGKADV